MNYLMDNGYFGELVMKFNHGNVTHMVMSQGLRLETLDLENIYRTFIKHRRFEENEKTS